MKFLFISFVMMCVGASTYSQEYYQASTIPENLKAGAHVVKRFEEITFHVWDLDKASINRHCIYTVLDEEGSSKLFFSIYTTRMSRVDEVDIKVYDALGNLLSRLKKKNLQRQASQGGLVEDGMYHYTAIPANTYPVTVELNYETDQTSTLFYPSYMIQTNNEAVESSSFTAIVPKDLDLRFMEQSISLKPQISYEANNKLYRWEVKNAPVFNREEGSVDDGSAMPSILLAPNKFKCFNTYGDMTSWKTFGEWGYGLLNGLDELPDGRKVFFANMVRDAKDDREKVERIYKYLQENFRYVSIQLGIGGYKPFPASFTDEKKYGDCKGLSFYTYSVLKSLGIKSYCGLINSQYNDQPVPEGFPYNNFNHMILCVPQAHDTIWLECTSNTNDFAFLGASTENRKALLLTERGGVLASTPKSKSSNNLFITSTVVNLADDGSGNTTTMLNTSGDYKEWVSTIAAATKDDQKQIIVKALGFKQPDGFTVNKTDAGLNIQMQIEKIPQFSAGSKMFLSPRLKPLWTRTLPQADNRKQDYYFHHPFILIDTTTYNLPDGYTVESLPQSSSANCQYATLTTSYVFVKEKNQLVSVAKLELTDNKIAAAKYAEVKKFFDGVLSEGNLKLIIKKN